MQVLGFSRQDTGMARDHLIGAYGLFWQRNAVNWNPGSGPHAWQLLGRKNLNKPKLRVCDFRRATGFYVLFDEFRAVYVGLARGGNGIGSRLKMHNAKRQDWSRFCWFTFDDVVDNKSDGWSSVRRREALRSASAEMVVRECESLLISILGSTTQNQMRFSRAEKWGQLLPLDFVPRGLATRVYSGNFTDRSLLGRDAGG
jgi:hypothetical protein